MLALRLTVRVGTLSRMVWPDFALQRECLLFACPNKRHQNKRPPTYPPATRVRAAAQIAWDTARTRIALAMVRQLAALARCARHPGNLHVCAGSEGTVNTDTAWQVWRWAKS